MTEIIMSDGFDPLGSDGAAADRAVAFLKTLSHAGRLQILCHLIERDMNVTELCAALNESQATISQQLMRLRAEGFVTTERQGKNVIYRLTQSEVTPVIAALREAFCKKG